MLTKRRNPEARMTKPERGDVSLNRYSVRWVRDSTVSTVKRVEAVILSEFDIRQSRRSQGEGECFDIVFIHG
jgi:hypothetical protein